MYWARFLGAMTVVVAAVLQGSTAVVAATAKPPTVDQVFQRLGYSEEDKKAILGGKIISTDVKRTRDDQLIAAVALPIKASMAELAARLEDGSNIPLNVATLAWGEVKTGALEDYKGVAYRDAEKGEVQKLLQVKADNTFNFSSEEIAFLKKEMKGLDAKDPASAEGVAAAYRQVLTGRFMAYSEKGLEGVANYDHGGSPLTPAKQLRAVEEQAKDFLTTFFPDFWQALVGFPQGQDPDISSKVYWVKHSVEGRPAFILIHQMVQAGDDFVLTSQRQFYVGHTYESLQMIGLALPARDGAVIFSVNNVFTDQITGFFAGVAQSVGQSRTKENMTKHFKTVRQKIQ
jgi:hypothetical protein